MADTTDYPALLEEIHSLELAILRDQLQQIRTMQEEGQALYTPSGQFIDSLAIVRAVEMALKRNSISAPLEDRSGTRQADLGKLARKLDFKNLRDKRKVVPFPQPDREQA